MSLFDSSGGGLAPIDWIGVAAGAICGLTTAALLAYSGAIFGRDPISGADPVSFMWIAPGALVVNLTVGTVISYGLHVFRGRVSN